MTSPAVLEGKRVNRSYGATVALGGVSIGVHAGEVVALMGPSGSGKSTLLHCLAGILRPDAGEVWFEGCRVDVMGERQRSALRLARFGFVFQFGDLVPELTLCENVALPLRLTGQDRRSAVAAAQAALDSLGVADVANSLAGEASGGQVQRAAVARAVVHKPSVVFADEPTGSLDTATGELVLEALLELARSHGSAVVLVTHESRVAAYADREVIIRDGLVAGVPAVN